jgi:protoheme IX farnesyltransferase
LEAARERHIRGSADERRERTLSSNRYQQLAGAAVVTTLLLVTIGVVVRATDSGLACPTWPGCFEGQFLPGLDAGYQVWLEWIHRTVAVVLGLLVLGLAAVAVARHRGEPAILWPSLAAVVLVGFQAWLGRETVRLGNSGESVTAHLVAAMLLFGLLVFVFVRSLFPSRLGRRGDQRFTALAVFGAAAVFVLLVFGSNVTAENAALLFPDWPLMGGTLFPPLTELTTTHVLHRWIAIVVGFVVAAIAVVAWRTLRGPAGGSVLAHLAVAAAVLYPIQAVVGGAQVLTRLAEWTQTLHLALGATIWGCFVGLATGSYYRARLLAGPVEGAGSGGGSGVEPERGTVPGARGSGDTIRAYVALTKPRIIELLLVTTIPAMILAERGIPRLDLVLWTLVGGSLAAGSANAFNQVLERDIDERMTRTRRRPLPSQRVEPADALLFAVAIGVVALLVLAWFVNLLAAFLALLAIGVYVVVYTLLLKRTTPQNIVIGGAAGALPPVIGWAAVTGRVDLPAVVLFGLIFVWTPPHFWALALRARRDYEAAGVPMLPVVRGVPETARQIVLYTLLVVAVSLLLFVVGRLGVVYLAAAVVLGLVFLWRAVGLWRRATSSEGSSDGAVGLYRYSISYLSLLFLALAVDAIVIPAGL